MRSVWTSVVGVAAVGLVSAAGIGAARQASRTLPPPSSAPHASARAEAARTLLNLPLTFERNDGQFPARVRFAGVLANGSIAIHDDGFTVEDRGGDMAPVAFTFVNAAPGRAAGSDPRRTRSHYFAGRGPRGWHTGIPTFGRVQRDRLYPEIDVVYYGRERQLEYDLVVRPGGDPRRVALRIAGGRPRVDPSSGELVVEQRGRELRQQRPVSYQTVRGVRRDVESRYVIAKDGTVGIGVGAYDRTADLVIDPVVTYSTFVTADAMVVDAAGRPYVASWSGGVRAPADFSPVGITYGQFHTGIYVARLAASGRDLEFSTFIPTSYIQPARLAVDPAGTIYVAGYASGGDTPITLGGATPADWGGFLAALAGDGSLVWSRYVGQTPISHIAPRPAGGVAVAGSFSRSVFSPGTFTVPPTIGTPADGSTWVVKVASDGAMDRPAYIGNAIETRAEALAVGPDDSVYIAGDTMSPDLPLAGAAVQASVGTHPAGFITRLDPTQHAYLYSTYFGGRLGRTRATSLQVDSAGNVYVAGYSTSPDFAPAATQTTTACVSGSSLCAKVFLTKLLASGAVAYSNHISMALAPLFPDNSDPVALSPPVVLALNRANEPSLGFSTPSQTLPSVNSVQPRPADGPLVESVDGLQTFVNRGSLCESPRQIQIAPSDPRVIYVLNRNTDGTAVCRSEDGGRSWTRSPIEPPATVSDIARDEALAVSPADAHTLLFAAASGVKRSVDGGVTWTPSGTGLTGPTSHVAYDPHDASVAYTSGDTGPVLFRIAKSLDGGVTWTEPPSSLFIALTTVLGTTPTTILGNAGRRSTDGGATWQQPLSGAFVRPLASAPGNPSVVYGVQTEEPLHAVCRSDDAAMTWPVCSEPPLDPASDGRRVLSLAVDAADPRRVFGIFRAGVAYSTDGAASWTALQHRRDGAVIASHPTQGNHLFVGWLSPGSDVAVMRFSADGARVLFSTYLGGIAADSLMELRSDGGDHLYVLGSTRSPNFPLNAPRRAQFDTASGSGVDRFLTKIAVRLNTRADFDADGRSDVSVFRPATGEWFVRNSRTATADTFTLGQPGDLPAPADFDGDGQADLAAFRPSSGKWLIRDSRTLQLRTVQWGGTSADIPAPADYDGDGRADLAVFRPSNGYWYILQSATNAPRYVQWGGTPADVPAPGDYDGDGKADIAFFRPSNGYWYLRRSTAGIQYVQWGGTTADVPVPGDYDGDGRTDTAIFRPSDLYWYIRFATGAVRYVKWGGFPNDVPVPGDYDQDGLTDQAFFRPADGYWYILQSRTRTARYVNLGTLGDIPIPSRR